MRTGQFVKGIVNNTTEAYDTEGISQLLSEKELDKLYNRRDLGVFLYINKKERVLALSTVKKASDGERAGCITNHTVIVKFDASIEKDGLTYRLDPQDINEELANKTPILTIAFPKLKQPLDEVKLP
jgi:hypothetical protein